MAKIGVTPPATLQCSACRQAIAFVVPFCPFCGREQLVVASAAMKKASITVLPNIPPTPPTDWLGDVKPRANLATVFVPPEPVESMASAPVEIAARKSRSLPWITVMVLIIASTVGAIYLLHQPLSATLIVSAVPGVAGDVLIDGASAGLPGSVLHPAIGVHIVSFLARGWTVSPREVSLAGGQSVSVVLHLSATPATLAFQLDTPGVAIRLDDRSLSVTQTELTVEPGQHRLVVSRRGFEPATKVLILQAGERRVVPITLKPLATRLIDCKAPVGAWSDPVPLPPQTEFRASLNGSVRIRVDQTVFLVRPGAMLNLGKVSGSSMQFKAVESEPVDVRIVFQTAN